MILTTEEKNFVIANFKKFGSYTILKSKYCSHFKTKTAPTRRSVKALVEKFEATGSIGSIEDLEKSGRLKTESMENIDEVRI